MGVFYDNECTIKTKHNSPDFEYGKFRTMAGECVDCSVNHGDKACGELYRELYHCMNGRGQLGERDDNMSVCSAVKKAFAVIDYGGVKKRHSGIGEG